MEGTQRIFNNQVTASVIFSRAWSSAKCDGGIGRSPALDHLWAVCSCFCGRFDCLAVTLQLCSTLLAFLNIFICSSPAWFE